MVRPNGAEEFDTLLVAIDADAGSIEFGEGVGYVQDASSRAVNGTRPSGHRIVAAPRP